MKIMLLFLFLRICFNKKIQFNHFEKVHHYKFFSWDDDSAVEIICSCVDSLLIRGTSGIMAVDFDIVLD